MHQVVVDGLEDLLSGSPGREIQEHLDGCEACLREVTQFRELSGLLASLRPTEPITPPLGFAARVVGRIEEQRQPSFWALFQPAFARRMAFASLLALAALASVLISQETGYRPLVSADIITAGEEAPPDRDRMLVTLTSYRP